MLRRPTNVQRFDEFSNVHFRAKSDVQSFVLYVKDFKKKKVSNFAAKK